MLAQSSRLLTSVYEAHYRYKNPTGLAEQSNMASTPPILTASPIQDSFIKLYNEVSDLGPTADYCSQILQGLLTRFNAARNY